MQTQPTAFYPPTVKPSLRPLPLLLFLARFVRNPLRSLPRAVYDEPIVTYGRKRPLLAWVTDPALVETILLKDAERFPKTRLDRRVLKPDRRRRTADRGRRQLALAAQAREPALPAQRTLELRAEHGRSRG